MSIKVLLKISSSVNLSGVQRPGLAAALAFNELFAQTSAQ